ncbi:MAG: UDP-N-acetylglucosamine 2-epimerase, partial [Candidatus Eisenbacteria bacterium]
HAQAAMTLTDSGGLQEEACTLWVPCVTLRDNTERPESIEVGANVLVGADPTAIAEGARRMASRARDWPNPFGDGRSGERIVDHLLARG